MKGWMMLALLLPAAAAAAELPAPIREMKLANGLTVLLVPDSAATTVDVCVWYRAGSRWERPGHTGITHLVEGLMFGGSKRFGPGEHRRLINAAGGTLNTFTTADFSCFFETVPPAALDLALTLEADRMASLSITPGLVEAAKRQLGAMRASSGGENTPVGLGLTGLYALAWGAHPYRFPVIGRAEDLAGLTVTECVAYWRQRYGPDQALLTVVGRMDPETAEAAVRKAFAGIPRRPVGASVPPAAPPAGPRRAARSAPAQLPLLFAGWRTPPDSSADAIALEVAAICLGRGPNSQLQRNVVMGQRAALFGQADLDERRDGGLLYAMAAARSAADTAGAERAIIEQVEGLATNPPAAEDLDRAKRQVEVEMLMGWQTTRGLAGSIGSAQIVDGGAAALSRRLERLRALTADDVSRAAARSLVPSRRNVLWLMPGEAPPDAAPKSTARPAPASPRSTTKPTPAVPVRKGGR